MTESFFYQVMNSMKDNLDNAQKRYGFNLLKVRSNTFKSGFYYSVRYKNLETNKWYTLNRSTNTDNEEMAKIFVINNRETIIKNYLEKYEMKTKKNNGKDFYSC